MQQTLMPYLACKLAEFNIPVCSDVDGGQIKNLKVIAAEVKTISTSSSNAGYAGILVGYASNCFSIS